MELQGASAVVFGGAGGFGEQTVRQLAGAGMKVVIADVNEELSNGIAADLAGAAEFAHTDVTSGDSVQAALDHARTLGPLRVVVVVNGIPPLAEGGRPQRMVNRELQPISMAQFDHTTEYFYTATYRALALGAAAIAASDPLDEGLRGVVITTASIAGFEGQTGQTAYSMAKGGVIALTLTAARDLAPLGIRVVSIAPGTFYTRAYGVPEEEANERFAAGILTPKRLGRPKDYATLALEIARNDYLNGTVIRIDGGLRFNV